MLIPPIAAQQTQTSQQAGGLQLRDGILTIDPGLIDGVSGLPDRSHYFAAQNFTFF